MSQNNRQDHSIWHPFTQMKLAPEPVFIEYGKGVYLYDRQGNSYLDAISSWWVNLHGHAHPYIAEKISKQLTKLEHVIFAGFTHQPAQELTTRLLQHIPFHQHIFYSDNGSTAVEVALKIAIQWWDNQGIPKPRFIAFEGAYHGDTLGAMSVGARSAFSQPFEKNLFDVEFIPPPTQGQEQNSLQMLEQLLQTKKDIAGFIFEPLVQGVAGMVMHSSQALDALLEMCQTYQILTIADEVMTGFGRTGHWFASDSLQYKPDLMCLSKGITGGTMALGATTCSDKIYDMFLSNDKMKTFFHGHSYTANPLACTAGLASLDLLEASDCQQNIQMISNTHQKFGQSLTNRRGIRSCRQQGTIFAIELENQEDTSYFNSIRDQIYDFFISKGILLRPLGNIIYILPPYCIKESELKRVYDAIEEALNTFFHS